MQSGGSSEADAARLAVLDAVVAAIERPDQVLKAAHEAADRADLITRLQDLLQLDSTQAIAIGDLQIFRFTAEDRIRLQQERLELRSRIDL
jgi:DNA gyrase/topoisomerase IV subunit A